MRHILITGGSGLIGKQLSIKLETAGYKVAILSRSNSTNSNYKTYIWNIKENYIEKEAIEKADYIIHLAGAGIADKRWSQQRKKELTDSRVKSTQLLFEFTKKHNPNLKGFIGASGIGYYGSITSAKIFTEKDTPSTDFLSNLCVAWENELIQFDSIGTRTVILRTGIVLSNKGGALKKMETPIKYNIGSALGSGKQYMPWIHLDDLTSIYFEAIFNNNLKGIYNAVAPEHQTNNTFTIALAKAMSKRIWLPPIPSIILKLIFGELSVLLLKGSRVSCKKLQETGFIFKYNTLLTALNSFYSI